MKRFEESFKYMLVGLDFDSIEKSPHSIFGLSKELEINYFNNAWLEFSKLNSGEPGISSRFTIGTSIDKFLTGEIKDYYILNYKKVLHDLTVWEHEYECSSVDLYRIFHQDVYPLKNGEGIIIVNSLRIERPFNKDERTVSTLPESAYIDHYGVINQCTNCRKTERANETGMWDWVPSFIKEMPDNVSHSICSICFDYFWKYR